MRLPPWWPSARRAGRVDAQRIVFVMWNAHGPGGVARTVLNLANHLSDSRSVEVVSVVRKGRAPKFPVSRSVRVTYLEDESPEAMAALLDARKPSVVISTRPTLHQVVSRVAQGRHVLIGQDHLNFETRMSTGQEQMMADSLAGLDCLTVLTKADELDYTARWPQARAEVVVLHNASPFPVVEVVPPLASPVVLAGGRLVEQKGFDRLIEAWRPIASEFPDWQLHICGRGPDHAALAEQIEDAGMHQQVRLLGHVDDFQERLQNAAVVAMSSRFEGFPMVLVESMSQGVPAVSFDCPRGPADIIRDGWNGRLVPDDDVVAFTAALRALILDPGLRHRMGEAALERARDFQIEQIGAEWLRLIDRLVEERRG